MSDELGAVVRAYELWRTAQDEEVGQGVDHISRVEFPIDADHQRLPGELVDDIERPIYPPIMRSILDEVVGPDMVGPLGTKTDT